MTNPPIAPECADPILPDLGTGQRVAFAASGPERPLQVGGHRQDAAFTFARRRFVHAQRHFTQRCGSMLKWALIFAVIGLVAGALGFGGIAGGAFGIAKFLFWAAIIIAVVLFLLGVTIFKKVT